MKKIVYYFGNEYIQEDSLAVKVAKSLEKISPQIEFKHIKDTFQLIDLDITDSLLLDVAENINKIEIFDANKIQSNGASTTHDFDLGFYLKLTGKNARILAIPKFYNFENAIKEVKEILYKEYL